MCARHDKTEANDNIDFNVSAVRDDDAADDDDVGGGPKWLTISHNPQIMVVKRGLRVCGHD